MRRLAILWLSLILLVAPSSVLAASSAKTIALETFARHNVRAGRRETVFVRVVHGRAVLKGSRLTTVRVYSGAHTLVLTHGGRANRKGTAQATFTVPRKSVGHLIVYVVAQWHGHNYPALNWFNVVR